MYQRQPHIRLGVAYAAMIALAVSVSAGPQTQPKVLDQKQIEKLVQQLGDESYAVRDEASRQLVQADERVLPALLRAVQVRDPEVQLRAPDAILQIERRLRAAEAKARKETVPTANEVPSIKILWGSDSNTVITTLRDGREVVLEEMARDLKLTLTDRRTNPPAVRTYTAASSSEFRDKYPDAWFIIRRFSMRSPRAILGGVDIHNDESAIFDLIVQVGLAMQKGNLSKESCDAVWQRVDQMDDVIVAIENKGLLPELEERFRTTRDALGEAISEAGLPPVAKELIPPRQLPLEVMWGRNNYLEEGILIERVQDRGRGQRIGLRAGDIVQRVNGQIALNPGDFSGTADKVPPPLTVQIIRGGQSMVMQEPDVAKKGQ